MKFALIYTNHFFVGLYFHFMNAQNLTCIVNSCSYTSHLSHVCLVLYHILLDFHRTWNNRKEFFSAHSTTEKREQMLTKTDSMKRTTILITTQQIATKNNTIGIYNKKKYLCLERYAWFCTIYIADTHFSKFLFGFLIRSTQESKQSVPIALITVHPYKVQLLVGANYLLYLNATPCLLWYVYEFVENIEFLIGNSSTFVVCIVRICLQCESHRGFFLY